MSYHIVDIVQYSPSFIALKRIASFKIKADNRLIFNYMFTVLDTDTLALKVYNFADFVKEFIEKGENIEKRIKTDYDSDGNAIYYFETDLVLLKDDIKFLGYKPAFDDKDFIEKYQQNKANYFSGRDFKGYVGKIKTIEPYVIQDFSIPSEILCRYFQIIVPVSNSVSVDAFTNLSIYELLRIYCLGSKDILGVSLENNIFTVRFDKLIFMYIISDRLKSALVTEALVKGRNSCYT